MTCLPLVQSGVWLCVAAAGVNVEVGCRGSVVGLPAQQCGLGSLLGLLLVQSAPSTCRWHLRGYAGSAARGWPALHECY